MTTNSIESVQHRDEEIKRVFVEMAYTTKLAHVLWATNSALFDTTPVSLHESYKNEWEKQQKTDVQFTATCAILYSSIRKSKPLLPIFPGLHVSLKECTVPAKLWGQSFPIHPDMLYDSNTIVIPNKSSLGTRTFFHEFGHHIHAFFTPADNQTILTRQKWEIRDIEGLRPATLDDLTILDSAGDLSIDDVPDWKFSHKNGEIGKKHRHSNPNEMIADTFADHYEDVLEMIMRTPTISGQQIISYLLKKV